MNYLDFVIGVIWNCSCFSNCSFANGAGGPGCPTSRWYCQQPGLAVIFSIWIYGFAVVLGVQTQKHWYWPLSRAGASFYKLGGYNFRKAHYVDCIIMRKTNKRPFDQRGDFVRILLSLSATRFVFPVNMSSLCF